MAHLRRRSGARLCGDLRVASALASSLLGSGPFWAASGGVRGREHPCLAPGERL